MTPDQRWLAATWPLVLERLPEAPARVLEIGCGPVGGFVPDLRRSGYQAVGIDPEAPDGPDYRRVGFERYDPPEGVDAIVASTSLHHVGDLRDVLGKASAMLAPSGVLVVVEWAWERFDEATARWCFDRLAPPDHEPSWLHESHAEWLASGEPWDVYRDTWAEQERLHTGREILDELDARFERRVREDGPYFFATLDGVTEAEEQAAIDSGLIQAGRVLYVGTPA